MKKNTDQPSRRGFLVGMLTGAGAVSAVVAVGGKASAKADSPDTRKTGPVLYRRTPESDRYYKTLYT